MKKEWTQRPFFTFISIALLLAMPPIMAHAAIPQKINYQGYLTDPQGTAIDGNVSIVFSTYSQASVDTALVALRFALLLETPTQEDIQHGDVAPLNAQNKPNPDGVINVGDALVILRKALQIISF